MAIFSFGHLSAIFRKSVFCLSWKVSIF